MDIAIAVAVAGWTRTVARDWQVSLASSLSLLGLSLLDAAPLEWNLVLYDRDRLTLAYECVLWTMALHTAILVPGRLVLVAQPPPQSSSSWRMGYASLAAIYRYCLAPLGNWLLVGPPKQMQQRMTRVGELPITTSNHHHHHHRWCGWTASTPLSSAHSYYYTAGALLLVTALVGGPWSITLSLHWILTRIIAGLSAVGLFLSAALNGFGSVSLPINSLRGICLEPVAEPAIAAAEDEWEQATRALQYRQQRQQTSSSNHHNLGADNNNMAQQQQQQLQSEIAFLQSLVADLAQDIHEMKTARQLAARARNTRAGQIQSVVGLVASVVLVVRYGGAVWTLYRHTHGPPHIDSNHDHNEARTDPVTVVLWWLTQRHHDSNDNNSTLDEAAYNALSQAVSLVLTAILSATQLRTFVRTVATVQRRWGCTGGSLFSATTQSTTQPNGILTMVLTVSLTCYTLAVVVLTQRMVPPRYRQSGAAALDPILHTTTIMMQWVFASSATLSLLVLTATLGIERQNTHRYNRTAEVLWSDP